MSTDYLIATTSNTIDKSINKFENLKSLQLNKQKLKPKMITADSTH